MAILDVHIFLYTSNPYITNLKKRFDKKSIKLLDETLELMSVIKVLLIKKSYLNIMILRYLTAFNIIIINGNARTPSINNGAVRFVTNFSNLRLTDRSHYIVLGYVDGIHSRNGCIYLLLLLLYKNKIDSYLAIYDVDRKISKCHYQTTNFITNFVVFL